MLSRLLVASFLMMPGPALANDTMAELETGGLAYVQSDEVSMEEEDLFISRDEIRVRYVFANSSDRDVTSIVAFPMPDILGEPNGMIAIPDMEADNFLGFSVLQDGKPIEPTLQQRVIALGIDMTEEVVARGIPLLPYSAATSEALEKLPAEVKAGWIDKGLIFADRYDEGEGMVEHLIPLWTLRSVYWWETTFPAGRQVRVEHSYKPSVGGTVDVSYLEDGKPTGQRYRDYVERYCIDDNMVKIARQSKAALEAGKPHYVENWISYVLTTGANWQGPIKRFKLTVDKGRPQDYVSFCGSGVKKVGPTTFEMTVEDFFPEKDLHILFLMATD
ncbi:DUF4424 domain-containing protein [Rhizobiaceae bacterium n13]|uniref:DUF4424 domain-containing protein n=1 Tax=Ferirhizobium litorale TaxID=2927786 RepID=A0AAE3Q9A2_9HYPH|nr:DUF4424 domain-containing protein [Fererhizobium litorale]MDI7861461.1 DUF4424 domain-containing protein [Fererhizobium litorale]MDI7921607.1 DUF4424 domain-containing protein [Fererhizobium litorale]